MKEKIKVSIIIPAYNAEKTIEATINSVIEQTYKNIELIVIDDGSDDNTLKILENIKDNRLKILKQTNQGPAAARNYGIRKAQGNYIIFLDSDDKLDKNIIQTLINILNDEYFDIIIFKTVFEKNKKIIDNCKINSFKFEEKDIETIQKSIFNKFCKYNEILGFDGICGKIIKKELLTKKEIYYPENIYRMEDAIFCVELYKNTNKIYFLAEVGYYYLQHDESLCHKFNTNICEICNSALTQLHDLCTDKNDFYIKCITTLSECENLYFFNDKYNKNYVEQKKEYFEFIDSKHINEALSKIDIHSVPLHYKIEILLLRKRIFLIYKILKKIYFYIKKNKMKE